MYIWKRVKRGIHSLASLSIIYKFVYMWYSIYNYIVDYNTIGEFFYSDLFKKLLKQYVNLDIKKDWIGRLYGIINPMIDIDGKLNVNNMIIEIDGVNTNNNDQVKHWLYKQLGLMGELFKTHDLYNFINMEVKRVGPEQADNFLVVFDMVSRQEMARSIKQFIYQLLFYTIIAICIILFVI